MRPFRTILFAADFSINSKEAFRVACSLAVENKTRLIVVHVVEPSWVPDQPVYLHDPTVAFVPTSDEGHVEALRQKLSRDLRSELSDRRGLPHHARRCESRDPQHGFGNRE